MSTAVLPTKKQEYTKPIKKSQAKKGWAWLWARGASQNLGFPFNIYTVAESRDFKFGTQLGFAKAHHKTIPKGKVDVALGKRSSQIFGVPLQYFCNGHALLLAVAEVLVNYYYHCHRANKIMNE